MSKTEQPFPGAPCAPVSESDSKIVTFTAVGDSTKPVYDERDRLVMLTPCYDSQVTTVFRDAVDMALSLPTARFRMADGSVQMLPILALAINQPNDSHIDRARNTILWHFEQTHYRFAVFCDGDQPFEPEHIARTWFHLMSGVRVVGGLVAMKTIVPTYVCNAIKGKVPDPKTGLVEVQDIGTGWLAFNRDVLTAFRERWPEIAYRSNSNTATAGKTLNAYFASGVVHRDGANDWLSEDWMFCHRCKQLGIPVYADTGINIRHLGRILFPVPPAELIEAALKVTSGRNPPFDRKLAAEASQVLARLHAANHDSSISILHATRGRPEKAKRIRELWHQRADNPKGFEYIFAIDDDDATSEAGLAGYAKAVVKGGRGVVAAINFAAQAATGRILVMAADDCEPPQGWDTLIRDALDGQLHEPRVLWCSDGYTEQPVITHPIITRAFYEQQGWFFCPEYPHLFCDTELTVRAQAAGQIIDARHIVLKHENPMFTGAYPDALHRERNSPEAWATGRAIFLRRNPGSKHAHVRA
jgi:hypothetical protein